MRCLCATVRRAARLLTRRYEDALRPAGVTVSQFELMMTLRALTAAPAAEKVDVSAATRTKHIPGVEARFDSESVMPGPKSRPISETTFSAASRGTVNQSKLAQVLDTDQTTLSRNLKLLLQQRWIETAKDDSDARSRAYRLTPLGFALLEDAQRCWRLVHEETERLLGAPIAELFPALDCILSAERKAA